MKNGFRRYLICWIIMVALFNVICFVTPERVGGASKFAGAFWPCYALLIITFLLHMLFINKMMNGAKGTVRTQLVTISSLQLGIMIVAGLICMLLPGIPSWIGVIISCVILGFSILFLTSVKTAGENAVSANASINARTATFNNLRDEAKLLIGLAGDDKARKMAETVYDALRFSDPTSSEVTIPYDEEIKKDLAELRQLITEDTDEMKMQVITKAILQTVEERNITNQAGKRKA